MKLVILTMQFLVSRNSKYSKFNAFINIILPNWYSGTCTVTLLNIFNVLLAVRMVADVTETRNVIPSFGIQNFYDHKVLNFQFYFRSTVT